MRRNVFTKSTVASPISPSCDSRGNTIAPAVDTVLVSSRPHCFEENIWFMQLRSERSNPDSVLENSIVVSLPLPFVRCDNKCPKSLNMWGQMPDLNLSTIKSPHSLLSAETTSSILDRREARCLLAPPRSSSNDLMNNVTVV